MFAVSLALLSCDKEPLDPLTFQTNLVEIVEGDVNSSVKMVFTASSVPSDDISVKYEVREKTARSGSDLIATSGTLEFIGDSKEAFFELELVGDDHFELLEYFEVVLDYGPTIVFTVGIADDDAVAEAVEDADGFITPAEYPSMALVWGDEFDGNSLDLTDWTYEVGDEWFNNELQSYTDLPENLRVEDGKLTITALEELGKYTSARIITQDKVEVKFGRIDIRARLPKGQGIWPALWMLGANINEVGWPACGEIDIMELVGHQPNVTHGTAHYEDNGHKYRGMLKTLSSGDFSDKYHVFSIVWDRNYITWYLDGQPFNTLSSSQINNYPFNNPQFFIMNIAVGGDWPGDPDETTVFPQHMDVDYVRVFQ